MRNWSYGINTYYKTASIYIDFGPLWTFALDGIIEYICDCFPPIPLPKISIIRDDEKTNLNEYYGSLCCLFHIYICSPISDWCWKHQEHKSIKVDYDELKKIFYAKDKFWEEQEKFCLEIKKND